MNPSREADYSGYEGGEGVFEWEGKREWEGGGGGIDVSKIIEENGLTYSNYDHILKYFDRIS